MKVSVHNTQNDLTFSISSVRKLVEGLVSFLDIITDEVIVHFIDIETMCSLHEQFFNDPTPTDCISIPIDNDESTPKGFSILGEIFVCPHVAKEYAEEHRLDPLFETTLYVVHALLHLIGYQDKPAREREKMRLEEDRCLKYLQENHLMICSM